MDVACIGGGPAGLYFAILLKQARPGDRVRVLERNRADDTFGWGVVFSDETLDNFERADPESYARITAEFARWRDIDTFYRGTRVRSTGHGFCGLSRKRLLQIFHQRCRELGVELEFEREVRGLDELEGCDLVLASDGLNSVVRDSLAEHFRPSIDWRPNRFTWLGTTLPMEAFTFIFEESEHGLFQVHAYPFQLRSQGADRDLGTFIVECTEETWRRAGLDSAAESDTVAFCEELFADHLKGHRLLTNRSIWRSFPTVRNERWHWRNVVLVGDAAHTAHFSIGSGTKLAMEDAIALADAFRRRGDGDVPAVLADYEEARRLDVLKLQKAAQTSLEWFEHSERYVGQHPLQFTFNLMTRSKRITWDNLSERDPALVERVREWYAEDVGAPRSSDGSAPVPVLTPFDARGVRLENRLVVSPMCQYMAQDGVPTDWHLVHLGALCVGGAGLVMTEMTDVSPEGRITHGCAGLWGDEHERAWKRIVDFARAHSAAKVGVQLAHAGRKGSCSRPWEGDRPLRGADGWTTQGPSALPFGPGWPAPREMTAADMREVVRDHVAAAERALRAGFDLIELHMAHGYLLSSFVSPLSNRRTDGYGGSLEARMRFPLEVFDAVRAAWPEDRPLFARISATDWLDDEGGLTLADSVEVARMLRDHGCDVVDVSSAGNVPESRPEYGRMYQVPFAERIRREAGVPVMAVGAIQGWDHANTVLAAGRADLCALARPHLLNPHLAMGAAAAYGDPDFAWPKPYLPARPARRDATS